MGRISESVKVILIVNILFFIGSQVIGVRAYELFALWFPENQNFQFWQVITHMFMHGGISHIFFNMFALYIFGSFLEQSIGQSRFLFLYFSAGLGAAGLQILFAYLDFNSAYNALIENGASVSQINELLNQFDGQAYGMMYNGGNALVNDLASSFMVPMVGASGAIFGITAAFAVIYPNLPLYIMFIPIPIKAKYLIGGYFLLNVYSAVTGQTLLGPSNIAYWAHIGGGIIGFITMWYWKKNQFNQNRWD
jgi:membrane associated rhomboid family serine protease